jgi:hypothetical protein
MFTGFEPCDHLPAGHFSDLHHMKNEKGPLDPQKAREVGVLSFMLNRVIVQQRMLAAVIARVEDKTEAEVLARMEELLKETEGETIYYLKKYWIAAEPGNGQTG